MWEGSGSKPDWSKKGVAHSFLGADAPVYSCYEAGRDGLPPCDVMSRVVHGGPAGRLLRPRRRSAVDNLPDGHMKNLDGLPQGVIRQHFALKRHLLRASLYRKQLAERFAALHRFTELAQNPSPV